MLRDFRTFVMRGSIVDLAIAVVIGAAFGAVVNSFVNDVLMPPIGRVIGRVNFADLFASLDGRVYPSLAAAKAAGAPTLNYGAFVNTIVNFVIVAFTMFLLVRQVNRFRAPAATTAKDCPHCATAIPLKARRCPHCTSDLGVAVVGAGSEGPSQTRLSA